MFHTASPGAAADRGARVEGACAGFAALGSLGGRRIGEVEQLFPDGHGEPRHLKVGGLFATRSVLIPRPATSP